MEKSKKKGSIRGRVKKRISKIQYQKAIKNESYYANLSALFLCVSIALGLGGVVAGSVLTVDIEIGKHVAINLNCTIGHDAVLQDYTTVYPGVHVSGNVTVGQCVELGTGSQIIQGKKIEDNIIVGAGSVVTKDLLEPGTYVGVPARKK